MIDPEIFATERVRPLRRAEYERLAALGFFEDERVELLEGIIIEMSPPGAPHSDAVRKLNKLFVLAVGDRAVVQIQDPVGVADDSEPQPDVAVIPNGDYADEHPTKALLLIEVAESSLKKDRRIKGRIYARAGVPEYWIVNLAERTVEVRRTPQGGAYAALTVHQPGETIRPQAFPDIEVRVADIIPRAR
jgi:Uma2 family endonuclease